MSYLRIDLVSKAVAAGARYLKLNTLAAEVAAR